MASKCIKGDILKAKEITEQMSEDALRVLAIGYKEISEFPQEISPESIEKDLIFMGLVGMIDPPREEAKEAVEKCKKAGIKTVMITGDHRITAIAIAKQLGILENENEAITGSELEEMSDEDLTKNVRQYSVYARVSPEHKVRIVNAWKAKDCITAMTGDGVNDAPAIKSADIGVGMGITGTDVTKNVADMVLTDDNFATIVSAVEEGRRIYSNIRKSIQFLLSSNLAEVLSIFVATLIGFTILKPIHLLWINLISDTFPALALGMEKSEKDVMKKPPRKTDD
jgi:Ca2+-transporting ATPase